jgi:hypothetical protein
MPRYRPRCNAYARKRAGTDKLAKDRFASIARFFSGLLAQISFAASIALRRTATRYALCSLSFSAAKLGECVRQAHHFATL